MISGGLEPPTVCVLSRRDNRLHQETISYFKKLKKIDDLRFVGVLILLFIKCQLPIITALMQIFYFYFSHIYNFHEVRSIFFLYLIYNAYK
jgi:hypothetical protein